MLPAAQYCDAFTPAGSLLDSLVAVKYPFEQFSHERFEVDVGGLANNPVRVAA